jgi:hypothetical protein
MTYNTDEIQPGWKVVDANGEDVGTVIEADGPELTVKKGGLFGGQVHIPIEAVADIETGRVEIDRAKSDLEG